MLRPSSFPADFVASGRVRVDRTQRNVVKQAASSLTARALGASLTYSKTLVNEPAGEGGHSIVMFQLKVPVAKPFRSGNPNSPGTLYDMESDADPLKTA